MKSRHLKSPLALGAIAFAAMMLAFAGPAAAATAAFQNGSFLGSSYTPSYPGAGFETLSSELDNTTAIPGWTVTSGSVDWIQSYWEAPPGGGNSIDMNGTAGPNQQNPTALGVLTQTFATDVHAAYVVGFELAGNPTQNCGPVIKTLWVSAADTPTQPYSADTWGYSNSDMGWTPQTYSFVATSDSTTLTFAAATSNKSDCGAALGDVSVAEIAAATGAQCKNGGWSSMHEPDGTTFKNQGDCVSYYATGGGTPIGS